jgi:hypothetical protein
VLTAPEATYLLAVQLVVRDASREEIDAIGGHLDASMRADLARGIASLTPQRDALRARLGVTEAVLATPREALDVAPLETDPRSRVVADRLGASAGRPVFRVEDSYARSYGAVSGLAAIAAAGAAALTGHLGAEGVVAVVAVGTAIGLFVGGRRAYDECSDPDCMARIPAEATQCPGCHRTVRGRITHRKHRLDAEDRVEREDRAARLARTRVANPDADRGEEPGEVVTGDVEHEVDDQARPRARRRDDDASR